MQPRLFRGILTKGLFSVIVRRRFGVNSALKRPVSLQTTSWRVIMMAQQENAQNTRGGKGRGRGRRKGNRPKQMNKAQRGFKELIHARVIADFASVGVAMRFPEMVLGGDEPEFAIAEVFFTDDRRPRQQTRQVPEDMHDLPGVVDGCVYFTPDEVIFAHMEDAFETLVQPASVRYRPIGRQLVVLHFCAYWTDRKGKKRRRATAFPVDVRDLDEGVYMPLPEINAPVTVSVTFMPEEKTDRRSKHTYINAFGAHRSGKPMYLYPGYNLDDDEWGQPIQAQLLERERVILAIPIRMDVSMPSEEEISAMGEQIQQALATQESIDAQLQEHEFHLDGKIWDAYAVLKQFGVTDKSSAEEATKARRAMSKRWHPDTGSSVNRWRKQGVAPPTREVQKARTLHSRIRTPVRRARCQGSC